MSVRALPVTRPTSDLAVVVAVAVLLGASWFTWYQVDLQFFGQTIGTRSYNGWQAPDRSLSLLGLFCGAAAGALGLVLVFRRSELSAGMCTAIRSAQVLLASVTLAALIVTFVDHHETAALGVYVALAASVVVLGASLTGLATEIGARRADTT